MKRKRGTPSTSSGSRSPSPSPSPIPTPPSRRRDDGEDETKADASDENNEQDEGENIASASDEDEDDDKDEADHQIRLSNAYPGATNDIGSVHQRRWFITLDRPNSGFRPEPTGSSGGSGSGSGKKKKQWVRRPSADGQRLLGFEPFYVRGPEYERSVVTGRLGREVLHDEGVEGFVPRKGWRPVVY